MSTLFTGVRKGDVALTVLLAAAGVLLMIENIGAGADAGVRIDSHSWLMLPLFTAAMVTVLWRRRDMLAVIAASAALIGVHVLAFGWVVRCGAGLPLAFALAYGAGRLLPRNRAIVGLVGTMLVQFLVLVQDSAAGLGIIPVTAAIGAVAWGVGMWLRQRSAVARRSEASTPVGSYV